MSEIEGFDDPNPTLEQYVTAPDVAATLLHRAALNGDLRQRVVVDLGAGTGRLAIGAAFLGADRVLGVERDPAALAIALDNERRLDPPVRIEWVLGDAARVPIRLDETTVVMNPPFGAQRRSEGDRPFLRTAAAIGKVSYSLHNAGSQPFLAAFAADHGGTISRAFRVPMTIDRQFDFHAAEQTRLELEAVRIEWSHPP